jgi:phosphoribosylformimino-5-aminoimidazole carboxamide ribotide isomerase
MTKPPLLQHSNTPALRDSLLILPAIDLKDGCCVRLRQGRAEEAKVYSEDPVAMARQWEAEGAEYLHVVDLDGAFQGRPVHAEAIRQIAAAISIPVEVGGGLRADADLQLMLDAGADRVILGTRACAQPGDLARMVGRFGKRLAVGLDARNGLVQVKGWTETSSIKAVDLARLAADAGVFTLIHTDTAVDGMLTGPNLSGVKQVCAAVKCQVIASGGIRSAADIRALRKLNLPNLAGVIVGKALYEGQVTLAELRRE